MDIQTKAMLLNDIERPRRRFQTITFVALAVMAVAIALSSYVLFSGGLIFNIPLHAVVSLFSVGPVATIALMLCVIFRRMNADVFSQSEGLRNLLDASPIGVFSLSVNGEVTSFNASMARIWHVAPQMMANTNIFRRQHFRDASIDRLLKEGLEGNQFEEEVHIIADGKDLWHWYRGIPVYARHAKKIEYVLVLAQDITRRKQMEVELAQYAAKLETGLQEQLKNLQARTMELERLNIESENTRKALLNVLEDTRGLEHQLRAEHDRLQAVVSSMGEGVIVTDQHGIITFMNTTAQNILGLAPTQALDKSVFDAIIMHPGSRKEMKTHDAIRKSLEARSIEHISLRDEQFWKSPTGRTFPVSFVAAPMLSDEFRGVVIVFSDISNDRQMDEAKSNFISIASHQLRTPLTAIRWLSELLIKDGKGKLEPQLAMYADDIEQSAKRMIVLVNSLLNVSRIEAGRLRVVSEPVKIDEVVQSVIDELSIAARGQRCEIVLRKPSTRLPSIPLDTTLIRQVIQNLLTNAIRYSRAGTCRIVVELSKEDQHVLLKVQDSGIGIPKEAQAHIFEKFYRASNAVKTQTDGTGLGLYICKLIVDMAGGSIWFESYEGKGTAFFVKLPVKGMKAQQGDVSLISEDK